MNSLILRTATRLLVSLMLVFSVYLLLRGHDAPGGGFLGAMIASVAFVLYTLADGPAAVRQTLRVAPGTIAVVGLGLTLVSGLAAALTDQAIFAGLWVPIGAPEAGELLLGTPLLFDVGVYVAVVGAVLTIILALEEN
jgi:multicomponent Na+:H+ antiporter subunit B